jgi:hypothetical protein
VLRREGVMEGGMEKGGRKEGKEATKYLGRAFFESRRGREGRGGKRRRKWKFAAPRLGQTPSLGGEGRREGGREGGREGMRERRKK